MAAKYQLITEPVSYTHLDVYKRQTVPRGQETDFVVKALEFYNRHLQRNKAHER